MTRIVGRPAAARQLPADAAKGWRDGAAWMEQAGDPRQRAAALLLAARAQARSIVSATQAEAEQAAAAIRQEAWEAGYRDGLAAGQLDVERAAGRLGALAQNAAAAHAANARQLDHEVLSLTVAIAGAVVRHEIGVAPDTILSIARAALEELGQETAVVLRVHPDDATLLQAALPQLRLPPTVQVAVAGDAAITPGGCLLESASGRVDATIEHQLHQLDALLREHLDAA